MVKFTYFIGNLYQKSFFHKLGIKNDFLFLFQKGYTLLIVNLPHDKAFFWINSQKSQNL
jgi:hypothetical protein